MLQYVRCSRRDFRDGLFPIAFCCRFDVSPIRRDIKTLLTLSIRWGKKRHPATSIFWVSRTGPIWFGKHFRRVGSVEDGPTGWLTTSNAHQTVDGPGLCHCFQTSLHSGHRLFFMLIVEISIPHSACESGLFSPAGRTGGPRIDRVILATLAHGNWGGNMKC